jgi:hypothetical protein
MQALIGQTINAEDSIASEAKLGIKQLEAYLAAHASEPALALV